ncbi:MAG: polysaccharide deacetylase family protein [Bacteroidales bacterium]
MKYFHRPPRLLKALFSQAMVWELPLEKQKIFLTFDDGPHPEITPRVLDLLDQYHARATFFLLGKNVASYPQLMHRILKAGHSVGNHTWSHPDGWRTSQKDYLGNVSQAAALIPSPLFRPPYGRLKPGQLRQLRRGGYQVVMWSYLTGDYRSDIAGQILLQRALQSIHSGSVVVLHDSAQAADNCLYLLEAILRHFSQQSFVFEPIPSRGHQKVSAGTQ